MTTSFEADSWVVSDGGKERWSDSLPRLPKTTDEVELFSASRRGKPLEWGPTPLNPYLPEVVEQQRLVRKHVENLFDTPPIDISDSIKEYVINCHFSRMHHRIEKNFESFNHRVLEDLEQVPSSMQVMLQRVLTGNGSPAESIYVNTYIGVPTYELAHLTLAYGQNMPHLTPMHQAVSDSVTLYGGELFDTTHKRYEVKGANFLGDPTNDDKLLHITRTNTIAKLPNDAMVYERSSFVYCLDDEQYQQVAAISYGPSWSDALLRRTHIQPAIDDALDNDDYQRAIPISSTTFVVDEYLSRQLLDQSSDRYRSRLQDYVITARNEAGQ